jgi:YVTN family beta-propeller protein
MFSVGDTVYITGCSSAGFNGAFTVTAVGGNTFSVLNTTGGADNPEFGGAVAKTPNAVFAGTADNNNVYVAGYGTNSVYAIATANNVVNATIPVGLHPVALAELPNLQQLYVANQGSGSVSVIDTANGDVVGQIIALPAGAVPVWVAAKNDSSHVYVLDANGTIYDLTPQVGAINCVSAPLSGCSPTSTTVAGAGSNFLTFDPVVNRLYVTNPTNSEVAVLDASVDPPQPISTINLATAAAGLCSACAPDSVTVLGDGSRAYVGAYQFAPGCTDNSGNPVNCVNTLVAVIDGISGSLKSVIPNLSNAPVIDGTACGPGSGPPATVWQPGTARFRVSIASSGGGSNSKFKVYVGQCDAGSVAVIDTYPANGNVADVYSGTSLNAPLSTFPPVLGVPPPENPVFVVSGP